MSFFFTALQIIKTDYLTKTKNQHQKDNDHNFFNILFAKLHNHAIFYFLAMGTSNQSKDNNK